MHTACKQHVCPSAITSPTIFRTECEGELSHTFTQNTNQQSERPGQNSLKASVHVSITGKKVNVLGENGSCTHPQAFTASSLRASRLNQLTDLAKHAAIVHTHTHTHTRFQVTSPTGIIVQYLKKQVRLRVQIRGGEGGGRTRTTKLNFMDVFEGVALIIQPTPLAPQFRHLVST